CSSLVFQLTNESAIYDLLRDISHVCDYYFVYFLLYVGPVLVVSNIFTMFILSRKEHRTPYSLIFIVIALDQSLSILFIDIQLWSSTYEFACGVICLACMVIFDAVLHNVYPLLCAHASWLAVIITYVRLRHLRTKAVQPTSKLMMTLCFTSFALITITSIPQFTSMEISWTEIISTCN
ncbi:hypothetical protein PMAYCL1PPCAC_31750, partial [Pristionchus mayeri]